jgi:hypothetical protein
MIMMMMVMVVVVVMMVFSMACGTVVTASMNSDSSCRQFLG